MPITNVYDVTQPPDTQAANLLGQDLRNFRVDVQQRMALISGPIGSRWNPATDAQPANWTGLLYFATDTNQIFQWSGAAWVLLSAGFPTAQFDNSVIAATGNTTGITILGNQLVVGNIIEASAAFSFNNGVGQLTNLTGTVGGNSLNQGFQSGLNPGTSSYGVIKSTFIVTAIGAAGIIVGFNFAQSGPNPLSLSSAANVGRISPINTTNPVTFQMTLAVAGGLTVSLGPTKYLIY